MCWKLMMAIIVLAAAVVAGTRASTASAQARNASSAASSVRAESAGREQLVQPQPITSYAEMIDHKFAAGASFVTVKSLIWGLDRDQRLIPAHFEYVDPVGNTTVVDQVDECILVFDELSEVRNYFTTQAGAEVLVDAVQFGIDQRGYVVTLSMRGSTVDGGHAVATGSLFTPGDDPPPQQACACVWTVACTQGTCGGTGCNSLPNQCNCHGAGRCGTSSTCNCPIGGVCSLPGTYCETDPQDPGKCKCL